MIKYRVSIGYYDFDFDNAGEAVDFAFGAKLHGDDSNRVSIDFLTDDTVAEDPGDN